MKFAVVGAGAIGAFLGARLSNAGHDVALVARGAHLAAMQANGVRVAGPGGEFEARPVATDDYESIGPVDFVFLTVKAHGVPQVAPLLSPLLGPDTAVVSAQNGLPWWYFQRMDGPLNGTKLASLDADGSITAAIAPERVIGCVIYPSATITEPGVVHYLGGDRFAIGELDGAKTERCQRLAAAMKKAGLRSPIRSDIRTDLWVKLVGNLAFNPISILTRASLYDIITGPLTGPLSRLMMEEGYAVAEAAGATIPISIDKRMAGAEKIGHHTTSMLQDLEAGRPMELESIIGAVVELGDVLGVPMPHTRAVYACANLLAETLSVN
jgi:2-dehydropantoate 2-reductase